MKRILLVIVLMAAPLLAQEAEKAIVQELVTLKYANPRAVRDLLANFNVQMTMDEGMKVISLSGRRANVTTAEEAIKQLDVPGAAQKDVELTVYFVVANSSGQSLDPSLGSAIPSDLESTVSTLKSTFPFKNYGLLDALSLRTRAGVMARTSGQLTRGRLTTFTVGSATVQSEGGMIELKNLSAGLKIPNGVDKNGQNAYLETGISTSVVDVKEGQKLVVGRSSLNGPDTPLFLVLIAKVAQ